MVTLSTLKHKQSSHQSLAAVCVLSADQLCCVWKNQGSYFHHVILNNLMPLYLEWSVKRGS